MKAASIIAIVAGRCARCGDKARLTKYCGQCAATMSALRSQYEAAVRQIFATATAPPESEWLALEQWRATVSLDDTDAQTIAAPYIYGWLTHYVDAAVRGVVREEQVTGFRRACGYLRVPATFAQPLDVKLYREFLFDRIRDGAMPRASAAGLHLPTDEICYLNVPAQRWRYLQSGARAASGQLVLTNRKLRFSSYERGGELPLSKIMSALDLNPNTLTLETTSGSLSGDYTVSDAEWVATVIDTALKIDRRTLLPNRTASGARTPIPQQIKAEVWQRDGGRCVECGATEYLEYDHVIPRSRGGADTARNLQILCRRCNLKKSDRI